MIRRQFLKSGAVAATGAILREPVRSADNRPFFLENSHLAWRLESSPDGIRSVALQNRLSGHNYNLGGDNEFTLVFSEGQRLEIPWWNFQLTNSGEIAPEQERGLAAGFHKLLSIPDKWTPVHNLCGGQKGRVYSGYGWFRHEFTLPEAARGKDLVFILGGYDEQDWNEHWVYLSGVPIGHRVVSGRWRLPGKYTVRPTDAAYAALQFGPQSRNLIAVRARAYDYRVSGLSEEALEQYVFRPFLFDQFISINEPYRRVARFELRGVLQKNPEKLALTLEDVSQQLVVNAHYELDGFVRRKWIEIRNQDSKPCLLLDVEMDAFSTGGHSEGGGHGKPVFVDGEIFCAIEHPAGINQATAGEVRSWHCPGTVIAPGGTVRTQSAIVGVAPASRALEQFHRYLEARSPRRQKGRVSIFTCFGTNNQWGACPTLNDSEILDTQKVIGRWQNDGVKLNFFTLDTGWPAPDGDLTEFVTTCYPDGPARMISGIHQLGMQFGLWFSEGWGGWANGMYPAIQAGAIPEPGASNDPPETPPVGKYRNGFPAEGGIGRQMCMAAQPYYRVFRKAVEHHVRENQARLIKFDSGNYYCNSTRHAHLPGKYSTEAISNHMIEIVQAARALARQIFVMWYWGEGSPFWALHGDAISESGLFMEGSGTSQFPTLYYRDSVTLSLDQNTQFAKLIPPMNKDSLGVWLSQIRWANFMGKERWREALVMDLGRGSLIFPQLWGDPNLLNDNDVRFLAEIIAFARTNEELLMLPRRHLGDTWKNEPYGYAFCRRDRGLLFCNNAHFTPRKLTLALEESIGLSSPSGVPLHITTHFPERTQLVSESATPFRAGDPVHIWMRPFETLLLEIGPSDSDLPQRRFTAAHIAPYGMALRLNASDTADWMRLQFADAERFEHAGMRRTQQCFSSRLPKLAEGRHVLAIAVKLTRGGRYYRYSPVVAEIVQVRGHLAGREIQMVPVPDARRYGNTQHAGCSWVLYKLPLASRHSEELLEFAVHAYLPERVDAHVEAWIVKQWWQENTRPEADGFYGDAPS
jgi:hypothetical protein